MQFVKSHVLDFYAKKGILRNFPI